MKMLQISLRACIFIFFFINVNSNSILAQSFIIFGGENGQYWQQGSIQTIKWSQSILMFGNIDILLWNGSAGKYTTLVTNFPSKLETFTWTIPDNFPTGNTFKIKIQDSQFPQKFILSDNFFEIRKKGKSKGIDTGFEGLEQAVISYPNPVTDFLNIKYLEQNEIGNIQVLSFSGIKILETEYKEKIDVDALPPGVYFVKIGKKIGKFVKI
ncbi:MAG: hypothetical protein HW421_1759 [Ignavibacteria bacterium]|nr:hypothetical protein [Ignavibacteria bacterium]